MPAQPSPRPAPSPNSPNPFIHACRSLGGFSRLLAPPERVLRDYQLEAGRAIVESIKKKQGKTFVVMMARQSGKNELSAQIEAFLLNRYAQTGGQIVKAAPSFRPQITNSDLRLREILKHPALRGWTSREHLIQLGLARILFFSAAPAANVVGATASIALFIDEAQDVDEDVYNRCFRPMASTTNATTVLYGTAWDGDSILEHQREINDRHERQTGERLNFVVPWTTLAAVNPAYDHFVRGEIDRLGIDHPTIQTQYLLTPVHAIGRLFSDEEIDRMIGTHSHVTASEPDKTYVAGVDIAGEVNQVTYHDRVRVLNRHDETVITILEVDHDERRAGGLPTLRVVDIVRWKGITHADQYPLILGLLRDRWNVRRAVVDSTGVGAGIASFLAEAMPNVVVPFQFTGPSKSKLGFDLVATAAKVGRLFIHADQTEGSRELIAQLRNLRYALRGQEQMEFSVPSAKGHDDCVMSLALSVEAAKDVRTPTFFSGIIRGRDVDPAAGWEEHYWGRESRGSPY